MWLADDEVHVWHVPLDEAVLAPWFPQAFLNAEERARANRFFRERDRTAFALARGVLRLLLEAYGVAPAAEVVFSYAAHGKPGLDSVHENNRLEFNLAHTRGMAVYAFARSRTVGVDVELVRELDDPEGLVERFFAVEERAEFRALPAESRPQGFFNGWTRKEAFIKALGEGLSHPLDAFAVTLTPGQPAHFRRIGDDPAALGQWALVDVTRDPHYPAALVVEGSGLHVVKQAWPPAEGHEHFLG